AGPDHERDRAAQPCRVTRPAHLRRRLPLNDGFTGDVRFVAVGGPAVCAPLLVSPAWFGSGNAAAPSLPGSGAIDPPSPAIAGSIPARARSAARCPAPPIGGGFGHAKLPSSSTISSRISSISRTPKAASSSRAICSGGITPVPAASAIALTR